ncbi:MAG TPA: hypothetical protein EYG80_02995 [Flavobacteriaceae bacterium]|nr:hypothetical protein [Flavobacteriaceae bacterium]
MKKVLIITLLLIVNFANAQKNEKTLKIFLDCEYCDTAHYKQELEYVEFVRDRKYADVHIFFTTQNNATNGDKYNIEFTGKNKYKDIKDNLIFSTTGETTTEEKREIILQNLRLGLIRYWIANGLKDKITLELKSERKADEKEEKDPWNKWTFRVGARGWFNGQESNYSRNVNGNLTIKQVKEKNKFSLRLGINNNKSVYKFDDEEIISERKSSFIYANDIYSVSNHLSLGMFVNAGNSLYSNKAFYYSIKPGIEYNLFDYKESEKKSVYINYKMGYVFNRYYEETVFNKNEELLWQHNLELGASLVEKWGNVSGYITYRSYLHDTTLNGFRTSLDTSLRLFKGFSLNLYASYGLSHDQINLRALGASREDILLQKQQIKSGYSYYGSVGLSYTFGSIYNTIVNPRFDL